jgi:spore maturation protein CgeB
MRMRVLERLGHEVRAVDTFDKWNHVNPVVRRIQQWRCAGSIVDFLNGEVLKGVNGFTPDLVWAEKQEYLEPETYLTLKKTGAKLLHFTPDPYFSLPWKRTRLMDESLPIFDYLVTSKSYEMDEYSKLPAKILYMPLAFGEYAHRPMVPASMAQFRKYESDVSFLGGWEPRREVLMDAIVRNIPDVNLKIWGYGWDHLGDGRVTPRRAFAMRRNSGGQPYVVKKNPALASAVQGNEVYADEYAWAISSARISLGFLRIICPDQHTTRTFEIPACGSMMLADRTEEHQSFFEEGRDAEFFASEDEMLDKIRYYLANEEERLRIARNGYERSFRDGYSYTARMKKVLAELT